jgi:hypothetical protein
MEIGLFISGMDFGGDSCPDLPTREATGMDGGVIGNGNVWDMELPV